MPGLGGPSPHEELTSTLKRAIFMRESQQAATIFQKLLDQDPAFVLEPKRQHELSRLLELGNEPNLALSAYQALLKSAGPEEDFYKPSLRAAGNLCYRVKDFKACRTYLEQFLMMGTVAPNERVDAETLLNKLPDGKGVRDKAAIEAAKNKPEATLESSSFAPDSNPFARLNDSQDSLAAPSEEYGDSSHVPGINLQMEDVPEKPVEKPKRPSLKLANLTSFQPPAGQDLPPPPPKKSPYGEFTPQEGLTFGEKPAKRLSSDEMQGMMFGAETPKPRHSSEEQLEKFAKTPPLSMDSRDIRAKANPEYNISTTKVSQPAEYSDLPTTDDLVTREALENPSYNPGLEVSEYKSPLFDVTPLQKSGKKPKNDFHERDTVLPEEEMGFDAPESLLFGNPAHSAKGDATSLSAPSGPAYEELLECYQNQKFAVILPLGAKISVSQVAEFLMQTEKLSESDARKAVVDRKGCLRSGLSLPQTVELYQASLRVRQEFAFVVLRRELESEERLNAQKVDVLTPGIRLHTEQGVKKLRWEKIRFITCGRLNRQPTVDLFVDQDLRHYRLQEGTMKFLELYPRSDEDFNEACKEFLRYITKAAPEAEVSHTVRNVLNGKTYRPQKFADDTEYDLYNQSLLLGHFGEVVPMKELALAFSAVSSAW